MIYALSQDETRRRPRRGGVTTQKIPAERDTMLLMSLTASELRCSNPWLIAFYDSLWEHQTFYHFVREEKCSLCHK